MLREFSFKEIIGNKCIYNCTGNIMYENVQMLKLLANSIADTCVPEVGRRLTLRVVVIYRGGVVGAARWWG